MFISFIITLLHLLTTQIPVVGMPVANVLKGMRPLLLKLSPRPLRGEGQGLTVGRICELPNLDSGSRTTHCIRNARRCASVLGRNDGSWVGVG